MRNSRIVTPYKDKTDKGDCNNYCGISLFAMTGKLFARIILKRLQELARRIVPDLQCGFRSSRSTTNMIFTLRQPQAKMPRTEEASLHSPRWSYESIWHSQQTSTLHGIRKYWLPSHSPQTDNFLPSRHESLHLVCWQNIRLFWHSERSEAGMCSCPDLFQNLSCCFSAMC